MKILGWNILGWLFLACFNVQAAGMIELRYQDQDPGDAAYQTRILITDRYLRLDNGGDKDDFVLLDRKSGDVMNVLHGQKTLVRMHNRPLPRVRPPAYKVEEKVTPVRNGTVRVQILADGKLCSETVAAKAMLPGAADALIEYKSALAYTQWLTYQNTPQDLRQDCDLVHHVWHANLALEHGLPLEERDYAGRTRQLTASGRKPLKPELFRLPKNYALMQPPDADSVESK